MLRCQGWMDTHKRTTELIGVNRRQASKEQHTHALCSGSWKAVVAHSDKEGWGITAHLPVSASDC